MASERAERRLAAIVSADVVGYSRLMAEDEEETVRRLKAYREQIELLVGEHRGRVVDFTGDNCLAEFSTVLDAVQCAIEIQRVLRSLNAELPEGRRMQLRIGVHLGDVRADGERIYGDGVNIAARLEALAEPGGICVSGEVHGQVRHKIDLEFEDLGDQQLKNMPDPVRVYRVRLHAEEALAPASLPGMEELTVPGFSGRPAIAILPFDNLSDDPEQEYFADGVAEDLITQLSSWRMFPVIARNSSFVYKGAAVDVKQVSRELGVRYVVEGSVRKVGNRVRITAQLIDATSGHHVWAERYDRELEDVLAVQDEITEAVAAAMYPELQRFEWRRVAQHDPQDSDSYSHAMRGWWHYQRYARQDNAQAESCFRRAIELNPQSSGAFVGLAWTLNQAILSGWTDPTTEAISEVAQAAQRSVELNASSPSAQLALMLGLALKGSPQEAIGAALRATELNPSDPVALSNLADLLAFQCRAEEAIANVEMAMRLSPRDPMMWYFFSVLAGTHFAAGRYEDAIEWARRSTRENSRVYLAWAYLASSYAHLGRLHEARAAFQDLLRVAPNISVTILKTNLASAAPDFLDRYLDGLHQAGLPE